MIHNLIHKLALAQTGRKKSAPSTSGAPSRRALSNAETVSFISADPAFPSSLSAEIRRCDQSQSSRNASPGDLAISRPIVVTILHDWLLQIVGALTAPTALAPMCRVEERQQHQ
jgi:hypothetical protein